VYRFSGIKGSAALSSSDCSPSISSTLSLTACWSVSRPCFASLCHSARHFTLGPEPCPSTK
jgi:hypothetical protein